MLGLAYSTGSFIVGATGVIDATGATSSFEGCCNVGCGRVRTCQGSGEGWLMSSDCDCSGDGDGDVVDDGSGAIEDSSAAE